MGTHKPSVAVASTSLSSPTAARHPPSDASVGPTTTQTSEGDSESLLLARLTRTMESVIERKIEAATKQAVLSALSVLPTAQATPSAVSASSTTASSGLSANQRSPLTLLQQASRQTSSVVDPIAQLSSALANTDLVDDENASDAGDTKDPVTGDGLLAPLCLPEMLTYGSALNYTRLIQWNRERNKHECETLAMAIDALLHEGLATDSKGLDILFRRFVGVHLADAMQNNFHLCDALQFSAPNMSLLPRHIFAKTMKSAKQMESLMKPKTSGGFSRSGGTQGRRQRQPRQSGNREQHDQRQRTASSGGARSS